MTDRAQIGNVEILAFVDIGPTTRPTNQVFPDVPSSEWDNYKNTLTDSGELPFQMGFFALRSNGQTIVVDTGLGKGPHEAMGGITGQALENLKKAGIRVEDVNSVLITVRLGSRKCHTVIARHQDNRILQLAALL